MKKTNFLKFALTLVMAFVIYGADAQILSGGDYDETNATAMYQTVGTTFRIYVYPDMAFSPLYNEAGNAGIDATARWTWDVGGLDAGVAAPWVDDATPIAQNYLEITAPAVASAYTVTVAESNTAAGCTGALQNQVINVIGLPTGTVSTADITSWATCGDKAAQTVTLTFTENIPTNLASYSFQVIETIEFLDGSGAVTGTHQAATVIQDFTPLSKVKATNLGTLPSAAFATAYAAPTTTSTFTFNTDALIVQLNGTTLTRTRYTYTVTRSGDNTNDDFISAITHKSDYIGGIATYASFSDNSVLFIVNPTPVTGPIYHISNMWAN